jgi:hypothetical protein
VILSLPDVLTSIYSFDIDSMYQKINQTNVIDSTTEEIRRAASIIGADFFFVVIDDTALGNKIDQTFWYNSEQVWIIPTSHCKAQSTTAVREWYTLCTT